MSLNAMASPATREPDPLVILVRCRTPPESRFDRGGRAQMDPVRGRVVVARQQLIDIVNPQRLQRPRHRRLRHRPGRRDLPLRGHVIARFQIARLSTRVTSPEKRPSEALGQLAWRESGQGSPNPQKNIRDPKHGALLRHLPSGYPQVNTAWT